jgi:phage terminase large subunit GpA-like protein
LNLVTHPTAKQAWRSRRGKLTRATLSPPPRLTGSEWADRYRYLSRENSASPGRFRVDRVPYLREILDVCTDRHTIEAVVMKGAQVAFTEGVVNNVLGYHIDQDPAPVLVVQPTLEDAENWSKEKLAPMLRDTPRLRGKVKDVKSRDSGNTILAKSYPGGHLGIVGANAPRGLSARPRRVILFDEIDRYGDSAGTEGDPIALGEKRTITFWNRKIIKGSTPTVKGKSKIEKAFARSDQRRYYVPCPDCGHFQTLRFENLKWDKVGEGKEKRHRPETVHYVCEDCGVLIPPSAKVGMVARGKWIAENPSDNPAEQRPAGFHISGLISSFLSWSQIVVEFLRAKDILEELKVFVNTILGETFEEQVDKIEPTTLMQRREVYAAEVPSAVGVLTMAVDVQSDRLEYQVKGYGEGEESWVIDRGVANGDPADMGQLSPWRSIDLVLDKAYNHEDGATLRIAAAAVDTGGHHYDAVCRYVKSQSGRTVFAIKGSSERGKPIWPLKPAKNNKHGVKVYLVGTDTAKDLILGSRVRRAAPGPGYMHYPKDKPWCDEEYFAQLTSEVKTRKLLKGRWVPVWSPIRDRNETLDLEVYCFAALNGLGSTVLKNLGVFVERIRKEGAALRAEAPPVKAPEDDDPINRPRKKMGWMSSLRRPGR